MVVLTDAEHEEYRKKWNKVCIDLKNSGVDLSKIKLCSKFGTEIVSESEQITRK